jgi:hypothetical protein
MLMFVVKMPTFLRNMAARFGVFQPLALISSTIGIFLIMATLFGLWFDSGWHQNPNSLRSKLAVRNWVSSAIGLCSAVLRTCLAMHLGTCCMMLAALAFEHNCVLLRDAAAMSIYRYAASSPYSMIFPVLRGTRAGKNVVGITLVALLVAATVLSQFLSAILLSDMGLDLIIGRPQEVQILYRDDLGRLYSPYTGLFFEQKPVVFPRFAEKPSTGLIILSDNKTGRGLRDTGPVMRAMLPFSTSEQRSSVLYYDGMADVIESHVLCVSPDLARLSPDTQTRRINGTVTASFVWDSAKELEKRGSFKRDGDPSSLDFDFSFTPRTGTGYIILALSKVNETVNCTGQGIPTTCMWDPENLWLLVIRQLDPSNDPSLVYGMYYDTAGMLYRHDGFRYNGTEWISNRVLMNDPDLGQFPITVEMTMCVVPVKMSEARIIATASMNGTEPVLGFSKSASYNASAIRMQLGSTDMQQQGFLNLTEHEYRGSAHGKMVHLDASLEKVHPIYYSIFTEIAEKAGSVVHAVQAIFTLMKANSIYDEVQFFDNPTTATVQTVHVAIVPTRKRGLLAVCGIIIFHFFCITVIFTLYFTIRVPTFLDQAWHTVAQLYCGEARAFLDDASAKGDAAVGRLSAVTTNWDKLVEISSPDSKTLGIHCQTTSYELSTKGMCTSDIGGFVRSRSRSTNSYQGPQEDNEQLLKRGARDIDSVTQV